MKTGTADELISALNGATALDSLETIELCALWKTHEAAGVRKQAKKALEKLAPGPFDSLKAVFKASLGNDDAKVGKKLTALAATGGFPDVAALAEALARRTEEHLGLAYLCQVGGALATKALQNAVSTKGHLDLSAIKVFPDELRQIDGIVSLELRRCGLSALPPPVLGMTSVTVLDLSGNRLSQLPDEIRELSNLEKLVLHDVPLSKGLGQGIYDLEKLRELSIIRGKMKTIPEDVGRISSLEHLRFVQCHKVQHIPDSVTDLPHLKTLEIDWCDLQKINPVVWTLNGLEHLDLSQSPLDALPAEIGGMAKLKKLRLLCEKLVDIPDEICGCTDLEVFDIRGQMTRLPEDIGNWQKLKRFSVSFCSLLESVPESFWSIPKLEYVDFKYTRIPKEDYERARQTWPEACVCS
ncbi:hypothetical protein ACFL6C_13045 [Myxococcota bacterium]